MFWVAFWAAADRWRPLQIPKQALITSTASCILTTVIGHPLASQWVASSAGHSNVESRSTIRSSCCARHLLVVGTCSYEKANTARKPDDKPFHFCHKQSKRKNRGGRKKKKKEKREKKEFSPESGLQGPVIFYSAADASSARNFHGVHAARRTGNECLCSFAGDGSKRLGWLRGPWTKGTLWASVPDTPAFSWADTTRPPPCWQLGLQSVSILTNETLVGGGGHALPNVCFLRGTMAI